jgi:hypothetical protein
MDQLYVESCIPPAIEEVIAFEDIGWIDKKNIGNWLSWFEKFKCWHLAVPLWWITCILKTPVPEDLNIYRCSNIWGHLESSLFFKEKHIFLSIKIT